MLQQLGRNVLRQLVRCWPVYMEGGFAYAEVKAGRDAAVKAGKDAAGGGSPATSSGS